MKHKVVYNDCYGGYTLSDKAIEWLSEHGSEKTKQFIAQKRLEAAEKIKDYVSKSQVTADNISKFYIMDYVSKSQVTADNISKFYIMDAVRSFLKRHDPDLVAVVEALGKEVNGTFSDLAIEEIEGDLYNIDEYDGKETVVTPDDIEWTVIK